MGKYPANRGLEDVQPAIIAWRLQATVDQVSEAQVWHRHKLKARAGQLHRTRAYARVIGALIQLSERVRPPSTAMLTPLT